MKWMNDTFIVMQSIVITSGYLNKSTDAVTVNSIKNNQKIKKHNRQQDDWFTSQAEHFRTL